MLHAHFLRVLALFATLWCGSGQAAVPSTLAVPPNRALLFILLESGKTALRVEGAEGQALAELPMLGPALRVLELLPGRYQVNGRQAGLSGGSISVITMQVRAGTLVEVQRITSLSAAQYNDSPVPAFLKRYPNSTEATPPYGLARYGAGLSVRIMP